MLWFSLSSHPSIFCIPSHCFLSFPFPKERTGLAVKWLGGIYAGNLEALTWAHCSNSFFSNPLHTAIHDCHVTLRYSLHSTFDIKSVAHCSPIGENPLTFFRSHFRYRYGYDMVPEWKVIDWSIVWWIYIHWHITAGNIQKQALTSSLYT